MSLLRRSKTMIQQNTNQMKPSPKHSNDWQIQVQGSTFFLSGYYAKPNQNNNTVKGISLFISRKKLAGSMTVEAAIVLPLFLFFFLNLGCAIELIRLHGNMEIALCDVGKRISTYGYILTKTNAEQMSGDAEPEWWSELKDVALSYTYIKGELVEYLGEDYLQESPIQEGIGGIQFLESEIFNAEDCVDLVVTYKAAPFMDVVGFRPFRMANRYYAHIWNGYCIPGASEEIEEGRKLVYVTENGEVYHENRNCWHLALRIQQVSIEEAHGKRNENGERYLPCEVCAEKNLEGPVYIAADGNAIHCDRSCPGLKRTIYTLPRDEAEHYRPCSECTG